MSRNADGTFTSLVPALNDAEYPRDDMTIPQFMLDYPHPLRPARDVNSPWLIEDETGRTIGFEEVRARVWGLANAISRRWPDISEDDVVCIFSPNNVDYPIAIWAAHRLSLAVSCGNPGYTEDELVYQLEATKAKLLFVHPGNIKTALNAAKRVGLSKDRLVLLKEAKSTTNVSGFINIDDLVQEGLTSLANFKEKRLSPGENKSKIAFYSFSSGTTGKPKAVAIPHHSIIANVIQTAAHAKIADSTLTPKKARYRRGDVAMAVLPMFHIYGLIVVTHFHIFTGLPLVVIPKFSFVDMLKSIVKYRITTLCLVPPQVVLFCKHPATKEYDLSHLHFCMVGAAPLSPELTNQFMKLIPNLTIGQGYGLTETATSVVMAPIEHMGTAGVPGSAGRLLPNTIAKVVKQDGTLADYDEPGELVVAGPQMALRYANNEQATKETFVNGWVHTGDEVIINRDGDLFIVDRLKEILKVRGFQVAPAELEGFLLDHPLVADVGVVGLADEYSGEVPLAFVVLSEEGKKRGKKEEAAMRKEIRKFVEDQKIKYKWLEGGIVFIDAIPKNPSGKILRRLLRDQAKGLTPEQRGVAENKGKL
ncbi:AMP binding enzyme [Ceratobasidium sp. AG-Ba]|nr:AMP binding enzyme [Ceratobasidium sp. AG-Ba]